MASAPNAAASAAVARAAEADALVPSPLPVFEKTFQNFWERRVPRW